MAGGRRVGGMERSSSKLSRLARHHQAPSARGGSRLCRVVECDFVILLYPPLSNFILCVISPCTRFIGCCHGRQSKIYFVGRLGFFVAGDCCCYPRWGLAISCHSIAQHSVVLAQKSCNPCYSLWVSEPLLLCMFLLLKLMRLFGDFECIISCLVS